MKPVATLTFAASLLFPLTLRAEESLPKQLEFEITRGVNPAQQSTYGGKVRFERADTKSVFKVTWTLTGGHTVIGWGVPWPKSGFIAVAYGKNISRVAIFKGDGSKADARWALPKEGAAIDERSLQKGKEKNQFVIGDGKEGSVTMTPSRETKGLATVKWNLKDEKLDGIAVHSGDFLAAASITGGDDAGIVIYQMTPDLNASGKWFLQGQKALGTEELKLLTIDGKAPAEAGGASLEKEVLALAQKLRGKKDELLKLKPTKEQIAQIAATADDAAALDAYTNKIFESIPENGLDGKPEQTEILIFTGDDLPGGYAGNAAHLKKDLAIYGFKFVKPGESLGMSFDGLVKLGDQWVMIPKMWRAFAK